jgi:thymidylate synthase
MKTDTTSEQQYLELLRTLLEQGDRRMDRTGTGTAALFGHRMSFDLSAGFPLFTTKRIFWKTAFKEMLWMLSGGRNIRELLLQNVRIWTDWPLKHYRLTTGDQISQEDFEDRIMGDPLFANQWGDLGPVYGAQWRAWPDHDGNPIDQVSDLVEELRNNPTSRRLIIEGWNVSELHLMALPPCHKTYQFFVSPETGHLSGALMQRSADAYLGLGWNIANLALLIHLLAEQTGYLPGKAIWFGGDVHLYLNHEEQARTQLLRTPKPAPTLKINRKASSIFDYRIEDLEIEGYDPHPHIPAEVAV